jgi:hypothetical protein
MSQFWMGGNPGIPGRGIGRAGRQCMPLRVVEGGGLGRCATAGR